MKNPRNRIKQLRNEHNPKLTQENLANEMGVTKLTISRWENEEVQIKPDKAQQLAKYFDVSVAYLFGYTPFRTIDDEIESLNEDIRNERNEIFKMFVDFLKYYDFTFSDNQIISCFNMLMSFEENYGRIYMLNDFTFDENNPYSLLYEEMPKWAEQKLQ